MDRRLALPGQVPLDRDLLDTNKHAYIAIAKLIEAMIGTTTRIQGFECTPTSPASMQIEVAKGQIFSLQNADNTAYGSVPADTVNQIVKQGVKLAKTTLNCPAPLTVGFSINYLVQVAFQETDTDDVVRTYYNSSDPTNPWSGPGNSGNADATRRADTATVAIKAGAAATTGAQTTPAPDAGYVGAWVIQVAYGATTVTAPNISAYGSAPFILETLMDKLSTSLAATLYLAKAGGVMTGPLTLNADPSNAMHAATKQYVDMVAAFGDPKPSARVATTANITLSGVQTIDGVAGAVDMLVLVRAQSAPAQNGLYYMKSGAWVRHESMDAWAEFPGAWLAVEQGSTYADTLFLCASDAGGTLGSTAVTWTPFLGSSLTAAEIAQLANIDSNVITNAIWAYLAATSAFGGSIMAAVDAAAVRALLSLGGLATLSTNSNIVWSGQQDINGTRMGAWTVAHTDIDALIGGGTFGSLIQGSVNGHMTFALRENDTADGWQWISGGGNWNTDSLYDLLCMELKATGTLSIAGAITSAGQAVVTAALVANDTVRGIVELADVAEMEAAADITRAVTPAAVKFSPSAVKGFVSYSDNTTATVLASYNVSSVTDNGVGDATINHTIAFSSANYCAAASARGIGNHWYYGAISYTNAPTASALRVISVQDGTTGGTAVALANWMIVGDF